MKIKGKQRSVITILVFSLFTLGIYFLYWYYANISELDNSFDFKESDTKPKGTKIMLLIYTIASFVVSFIVTSINQDFLEREMKVDSSSKNVILILSAIFNLSGIILNFKYLKLIDYSYKYSKMEGIKLNTIFTIYAASVIANLYAIYSDQSMLFIIYGILSIIYITIVQGKINLLWRIV